MHLTQSTLCLCQLGTSWLLVPEVFTEPDRNGQRLFILPFLRRVTSCPRSYFRSVLHAKRHIWNNDLAGSVAHVAPNIAYLAGLMPSATLTSVGDVAFHTFEPEFQGVSTQHVIR